MSCSIETTIKPTPLSISFKTTIKHLSIPRFGKGRKSKAGFKIYENFTTQNNILWKAGLYFTHLVGVQLSRNTFQKLNQT
jgi:hypothetical protein